MSGSRSAALALGVALLAAVLIPGVLRISTAWRIAAVLALTAALLAVEDPELPVVTGLQGTGSLTHRLAALDAAVRLTDRSPAQTLFGSGHGVARPTSSPEGCLQLDGFFAVDNQLVATFAVAGLVGRGRARRRGGGRTAARAPRDPAGRAAAGAMFGLFDVLEWTATRVLVDVLLCLGTARPTDGDPDRSPQVHPRARRWSQWPPSHCPDEADVTEHRSNPRTARRRAHLPARAPAGAACSPNSSRRPTRRGPRERRSS